MNKRCIVNVSTGEFYCKMQSRLMQSFAQCTDTTYVNGSKLWSRDPLHNFESTGRLNEFKGIDLLLWTDVLPTGSRPHSESPYGFKVHAIRAAYKMGYTSILWLDSPAYAVKEDISPIFDKIEKEGYYAMSHVDPLENYVGKSALIDFMFSVDSLKGYNLPSGSCYGFDFSHEAGKNIFFTLEKKERDNLFKTEYVGHPAFPTGIHRHDEAILSLILKSRNLPVFTFDTLFQSDSPECVIKSGGL